MYGLQEDFDTTVFVGRELIQICFSANTINFAFSDDISITLASSFVYSNASNDVSRKQAVPVSSSSLMHLIGHRIDAATASSDGTLGLVFDDGHNLALLDDSKDYESYSIRIGDKEIIV